MAYEVMEKTFSIRLTASEYEYLQQAAEAKNKKAGAFIRWLLEQYKQQ